MSTYMIQIQYTVQNDCGYDHRRWPEQNTPKIRNNYTRIVNIETAADLKKYEWVT